MSGKRWWIRKATDSVSLLSEAQDWLTFMWEGFEDIGDEAYTPKQLSDLIDRIREFLDG